jgi:hypothetical protein
MYYRQLRESTTDSRFPGLDISVGTKPKVSYFPEEIPGSKKLQVPRPLHFPYKSLARKNYKSRDLCIFHINPWLEKITSPETAFPKSLDRKNYKSKPRKIHQQFSRVPKVTSVSRPCPLVPVLSLGFPASY